jgi:hypothetical protein
MAAADRRISLAGKVLVDTIDAQLLEVHKQGQVVGFGVALAMAGRLHRRNERSTTTDLLYSQDIARLSSALLDATTGTDPAWRDQVLASSEWRWTQMRSAMRRPCWKRWRRHGQGTRTLARLVDGSVSGGAGGSCEARGEFRPGV